MVSEALYYTNPALARTGAKVLAVKALESGSEIVLDRTIFFPGGGGQPCDLGSLGGMALSEVREEDGTIVHVVGGGADFAPGDEVQLCLDVARRRDHTQQHSGQHLLSAVLEHECDIHTVGFHLGVSYSTIDVGGQLFEKARIDGVERSVNAWISENRPIRTHLCPPEDVASFKLRRKLPQGKEIVRVVEIDGYDWVACCGTHALSTGELRVFKILSCEKYKGGTRVYFLAGERAVSALNHYFDIAAGAASLCGGDVDTLPERVAALSQRADRAEAERNSLVRERAKLEVDMAVAGGNCVVVPAADLFPDGGRLLVFAFVDRDAEAATEQVKAGANRGVVSVALSVPDKTVVFMAPYNAGGAAAGADCGAVRGAVCGAVREGSADLGLIAALKAKMAARGGKGGGRAGNFRAVFPSEAAARAFVADVEQFLTRP